MTALEDLVAADFEAAIGDEFVLAADGGEMTLTLLSVRRSRRGGDRREPFAVVFRGPAAAPVLEQGIHRLGHPGLGELEIFLVPVALDEAGCSYEAVFT